MSCAPRPLTEREKRRVDELRAMSEVEAIDSVTGGKGRLVGIVHRGKPTDPNCTATEPGGGDGELATGSDSDQRQSQ